MFATIRRHLTYRRACQEISAHLAQMVEADRRAAERRRILANLWASR